MTQAVPEQRPQLPGFSKWLAPQVGAVKKKLLPISPLAILRKETLFILENIREHRTRPELKKWLFGRI